MKISEIDKNFDTSTALANNTEYYHAEKTPFKLYGLLYDKQSGYHRMPVLAAEAVSAAVGELNMCTSGGRVRFCTDSDFVTVRCVYNRPRNILNHMAQTGVSGFSVYCDGVFAGTIVPSYINLAEIENDRGYESTVQLKKKGKKDITVYFPLYNPVHKVYIGVNENAFVKAGGSYKYKKPIIFYGSSITQGGCASRPGNSYDAIACRMLDADYINLGFSGNCKAESNMCAYIANLDCGVLVYDYDHNAPDRVYLEQTHYPFYEQYRKSRPDVPIIMISRPDTDRDAEDSRLRRDIILNSYIKGRANGDKNLYFIDGHKLFGEINRDCCTVDGCHPNDLGFERMAETVYPVLKEILEGEKLGKNND